MSAKKKTPKRLTKRERKALEGKGTSGADGHIHCVACGAHLHAEQFTGRPSTARWVRCQHGSRFASCVGCTQETMRRLAEHDRTGRPVQMAQAWH
ncbi:MAG: hypothetical protein KC731_33485 [Myxococcales bacterium]|nr:hypothetical protein [Myxococcales bacterium]